MRRGVPEAHAGARAETLQERLSRVVLRNVLGWGLPRGILGRCLKGRASQSPFDFRLFFWWGKR